MTSDKHNHSQEDLQRIKALRLIDDDFMTICFDNYIEGAELLLKIILDREDLTVTEVKAQKTMKNLQGRDVWLDIYATDKNGDKYDIEVQRANRGADPKRARYHSSMVDADMLKSQEEFTELRESYVIFITENDVLGLNEPICHVDRMIREGNMEFEDGEHIIYVNGSMRTKDTALGRLMNDFFCTDAKDMCYEELSEKVRRYKEDNEGAKDMCEIFDEIRNEAKNDKSCEIAKKMIEMGKMTLDEIAECSGLSIEKIRELAGNKSA